MIKTALLSGILIESLCTSRSEVPEIFKKLDCYHLSSTQMEQLSSFKNPSPFLAILECDLFMDQEKIDYSKGQFFFLDKIQDPRNLGAIIRIADWFGLSGVIINAGCADPTNPKLIQASMGSVFKRLLIKAELSEIKTQIKEGSICGLDMNGQNFHSIEDPDTSNIFVLGSEGRGISEVNKQFISSYWSIPSFGDPIAESLNVATSAAVLASFLRQKK
jgi:TrmH family RNA methyltransferase